LKKYKYYYWFGFPALITGPPWSVAENGEIKGIGDVWESNEVSLIICYLMRYKLKI